MADETRNFESGAPSEQASDLPQFERKHPDEWSRDLNPDRLEGQNIGQPPVHVPTAYDVKKVHRRLSEFEDDDLKQIPVVPEGERLRQGAQYLDLADPRHAEFTATGEMSADARSCIVPKSDVPYTLWNRLRGIDEPGRST